MANSPRHMLANDGASIAAILIAIALILVLGSNLRDLWTAQTALEKSIAQQEMALRNNGKVEAQLDKLASGTQSLAEQGNPNAQRIIGVLDQNGIKISPKK
ncbi:MAG: hypothetical protein K2P79_01945 [Sphingomonas sp.]|nr:hypothetical protein [Sphingomonas sp.]